MALTPSFPAPVSGTLSSVLVPAPAPACLLVALHTGLGLAPHLEPSPRGMSSGPRQPATLSQLFTSVPQLSLL